MLKTFNCGVGFCLICKKKIFQNSKIFFKKFKPYEIGYISQKKKRFNLINN